MIKINYIFKRISFACLTVCAIWWLYCAISDQTVTGMVHYLEQNSRTALCICLVSVGVMSAIILSAKVRHLLLQTIKIIMRFKWGMFALMVLWQLIVWASFGSVHMGADQESIRETALHPREYSDYLSRCPNNVLITYIYWIVYKLVPSDWPANSATLLMQLLTILALDGAILSIPHVFGRISKRVGDTAFMMAIFLLGISGHIILVYTDLFTLILSITAINIALNIMSVSGQVNSGCDGIKYYSNFVFLGFLTILLYQMKPSSIIGVLAFLIIWILTYFERVNIKKCFRLIISAAVLGVSALFANLLFGAAIAYHMQLNYDPSQSYPMSHFMAMGLRDRGGFNYEDRIKVSEFNTKKEKNDYSVGVIKERLMNYGMDGYTSFLLKKANYTLSDGTFSFGKWDSMYIYDEQTENGFLSIFQKTKLADFVRSIYDVNSSRYLLISSLQQVIYIVMLVGILCGASFLYRDVDSAETLFDTSDTSINQFIWSICISILGALLFLMLFESGRSKYVLQFMPYMLLFASVGLEYIRNYFVTYKDKCCERDLINGSLSKVRS